MKKYTTFVVIAILTSLLCVACDPVYRISVRNQTSDTVSITAITTTRFHFLEKPLGFEELGGLEGPSRVQFKIAPGQSIECGQAIAELEDDLPFVEFQATWASGSVVAKSKTQMLQLFDENFWGGLAKPYQLSLK